jgi:hypothetical protein
MVTLTFAVTAFVVFTGAASAGSDPVSSWLTPYSCNDGPARIYDDIWEYGTNEDCSYDDETVPICVDGANYTIYSDYPPEITNENWGMIADIREEGHSASAGYCTNRPPPQGPDRYIYCAGAGDVGLDGKPLGVGQTLNLQFGEQVGSKLFPNATLGFWVKSVGLTCQLTPEQAALAAASTVKVNHTGAPNTQEGAQVYTFVNA